MGFIPHKNEDGALAPYEYHTASVATKVGEAMVFSSGKLAKCGADTAPEYIAMAEAAANEIIPAIHVNGETIFAVPLSAAGTALKVGDKVTIATDALRVTATTASGVAEIVGMDGTAAGSTVYVRF